MVHTHMYTYTCTQLKNTIAVLAPRLSYRLGTSTGSFSTDAKGFCCSLVQSTKTSQYAFHETMSTTVTNWDVDRMQNICKQIHGMSLDTANYVKSFSGAFDARLVNQEETVRVKWSWMVGTGELQTPAGKTMAKPHTTVMILLDDHQAEASGHQLREESSPAGFALSARPKPEQRAPDQEAQLPTPVPPPNDEYASAMIEIPTRIRVSGYSGIREAVPSLADMESRSFTCRCYWHAGGHCADWVENGWICPSLAKHSEEGGQCYCNPYNPFPFKNKHCRQAWVDRGWMCPWTPGNPIPGSTTNNAMEIELPWMRDTCYNCGSWNVLWSTAARTAHCIGRGLYGHCNNCGMTQP